ncbi:uncharacterized protein PAC_04037 [Phialocephala subalpina]|uniref:AB hydrolase-1 domain-containing protein n=1 Tax=Phialocephala subalpina TaxID=576137 RepID=A0A1L7WN10_9HELO|nr:uncharacterized protein PAC_04037 [Phialocephala subalpina]
MSISITPAEEQAIGRLAPRKLHQIFTLPATDKHEALKVSYSIAGPEAGEDVPTILFCGGMFGGRWLAPWHNFYAEKERVRLIFIDRPGFGGSTPVAISRRIPTFLETVPALFSHLRIPHIHLASHSSGTIFALNLLTHRPDLLYPDNPTVTFFSPWVHQSITSVSFLSLAAILPNSLLNNWDSITGFMMLKASPAFASSSGAISAITGSFKGSLSKEEEGKKRAEEDRKCRECYGMTLKEKEELDKIVFKFAFAENTKGGNDEARLCLKSVEGCHWDACEDYEACVLKLKGDWEKRVQEGGKKLKVKIIFGEEDAMIGVKGRNYWDNCWTDQRCGGGMEAVCMEVGTGNHDSVLDYTKGGIQELYKAVKAERI